MNQFKLDELNGQTVIIKTKNLTISYGENTAVKNVSLDIIKSKVSAIIGPSGCGKSTILRSFNKMNDFIENLIQSGSIFIGRKDILNEKVNVVELRRKVGMVFQSPNPFPKSIMKNVLWAPKVNGLEFDAGELLEGSLKKAALWDEVKDRLHNSALTLSGGQQQRLCIARTIAMNPEIILMDEPCSSLDPRSTAKIEELLLQLSKVYTIVIVTHNMQQASRISDFTHFFYEGSLIESGKTSRIFTNPREKRTEDYITGKFG